MMIIMMIARPGPCPDIGHVMYGFLFMQRWPQYVRYQNNTFSAPVSPGDDTTGIWENAQEW